MTNGGKKSRQNRATAQHQNGIRKVVRAAAKRSLDDPRNDNGTQLCAVVVGWFLLGRVVVVGVYQVPLQ